MFNKSKKETAEEVKEKWAIVVSVAQDPPSLFLYHLMMGRIQTQEKSQAQAQGKKCEKSFDSNGQLECARYYNMSI